MLRLTIILTISIFFSGSCTAQEDNRLKTALDSANSSRLILVNGGTFNRCQLAQLIVSIVKCAPKSVVINFILDRRKSPCDENLLEAFHAAGNVILAVNQENPSRDPKTIEGAANAFGIFGMVSENGVLARYYTVVEGREKWIYTLPMQIALSADSLYAIGIRAAATPQGKQILLRHEIDRFRKVAPDQVEGSCDLLRDRIVIVGYLGGSDEDSYKVRTPAGKVKLAYGTLILANVVVEILSSMN